MTGPPSCAEVQRSGGDWLETGQCQAVLLVEAVWTTAPVYTVEGRVLAAGTLAPLPGANVRSMSGAHGRATDSDGWFEIGGLSAADSLVVSYVGFWSDTLAVGSLPGPGSGMAP